MKLSVPGYYTYRESIDETGQVKGVETACAEAAETAVVRGAPTIRTQVSEAQTAPGSQLRDNRDRERPRSPARRRAGRAVGSVRDAGRDPLRGTPFWTGTFTANGDGSYLTDPVTLTKAGYYTYRERIVASGAYPGVETACGEAAETTFTRAAPQVKTTVSDAVVGQKTSVADHLVVTGLGQTPPPCRSSCSARSPLALRSAAPARRTGAAPWR